MESSRIQEEFSDYLKLGFIPVLTEDGSYSLRQGEGAEPMHSLGGALDESLYIYGEAIQLFLESNREVTDTEVISVGLGMGYNELLTALKFPNFTHLISYEYFDELEMLFVKRIKSPQDFPGFWAPFLSRGIEMDSILNACELLREKVEFPGALDADAVKLYESKKRLVLFDAYSSKTSADLWTEEFLDILLSKCEEGSVFSTYAATGILKRALKRNGFSNLDKEGYKGKRQSTLAIKKAL